MSSISTILLQIENSMAFCLLPRVTGSYSLPKIEDFQNTNTVAVPSFVLKLVKAESEIKNIFLKAKSLFQVQQKTNKTFRNSYNIPS